MKKKFELVESKKIDLLGIDAKIFNHEKFGTKHVHLSSDSNEKSFMVAFRTIPRDSTGVAHILEHTVLCGSQLYPVRDPFFMMIRRSLSTFMNAMTSQDTTMYPFATLNDQDFKNLLSVYLDATFFPNLNKLDFMQEGHRLELETTKDGNEKLLLKGVVYNEMKGAMSSVSSQLYQGLSEFLYPETTYKYNSGGDPRIIPELTYQELVDFHREHYHPSNASFFSHGKIDPEFLHSEIENKVLQNFEPKQDNIRVRPEILISEPIYRSKTYKPFSDDTENHHVVVSWLMEETNDPVDHLAAELIENILLENSASPLSKALENSNLGRAPASVMGLSTSNKQMFFVAGLEGVKPNMEKEIEELVLNVFRNIVQDGIPQDQIDSSLHQIELSQRIIGGRMPYGLNILLGVMPHVLDDMNALEFLDLEASLVKLKVRLEEKGYLEAQIRQLFLNNTHRVTFQLMPDTDLDEKKEKVELKFLSDKLQDLSSKDKKTIKKQTKDLENRQNSIDDESILPCVKVSDISKDKGYPRHISENVDGITSYYYQAPTNGIDYAKQFYSLENILFSDFNYIDFFSSIVTEVGLENRPYEEIQRRQSAVLGNLSFKVFLPETCGQHHVVGAELGGHCLHKNFSEMQDLIDESINGFRLDEVDRLEELAKIYISGREKSVTQSGHILAMSSASSQLSKKGALGETISGLSAINKFKGLKRENDRIDLDELLVSLTSLKKKIQLDPKIKLLITSEELQLSDSKSTKLGIENFSEVENIELEESEIAWVTESGVNFCAQAFETVSFDHPDAPALSVLGRVLHNGFLHSAIREKGGAYGSGALQDLSTGLFKFFSYRDPNIEETFDAFSSSIDWVQNSITEDQVEQGILGIISAIDKPPSPSMEAISDLYANLSGRTTEQRKQFRRSVISCSTTEIIDVTKKYLLANPKKALVSSLKFTDKLESMGFVIRSL